jgi:hypothetical protein
MRAPKAIASIIRASAFTRANVQISDSRLTSEASPKRIRRHPL